MAPVWPGGVDYCIARSREPLHSSADMAARPGRGAELCAVGATNSCGTAAGWELLDANRTALLAIDAQQNFLDKLPLAQWASLAERIAFVMKVMKAMGLPILATAEDYAEEGATRRHSSALLLRARASGTSWSGILRAAGHPPPLPTRSPRRAASIRSSSWGLRRRRRAVGPGSKGAGFRVVVEDAVATPPPHHAAGIRRIRDAGAIKQGRVRQLVRDVPTVGAWPARSAARRSGEDAPARAARHHERRTLHTPPPLFFCFSANRTVLPARGLGLGAPRGARAAPRVHSERAPAALGRRVTRLSRATFCFIVCFFRFILHQPSPAACCKTL